MSEDKQQAVTETASESNAKETPQVSPNDELIAESKKYRKRAQDAETRLSKLEKSLARAEEDKLKEKEEFKTLYEKASSKVEGLSANAEKWAKYEEGKRASLLEAHPEDDRESLSKLDLETLEYVTSKINNVKVNAPEAPVNPRGVKDIHTDLTKMSADDLKANWADVVANARAKTKTNQRS